MKLFAVPEPQRLAVLYRFLNGRSAACVVVQLPKPEDMGREGQFWTGFTADIGHTVEEDLFFIQVTPSLKGASQITSEFTINLRGDGTIAQVMEKIFGYANDGSRYTESWSQWSPDVDASHDIATDFVLDVLNALKTRGRLKEASKGPPPM